MGVVQFSVKHALLQVVLWGGQSFFEQWVREAIRADGKTIAYFCFKDLT